MDNRGHIHHSHRHFGFSYPVSLWQRTYAALFPIGAVVLIFLRFESFSIFPFASETQIPIGNLGLALLATFLRLLVAYALAVVVAILLALAVHKNTLTERLLLPIFDIMQSVPILAFFPLIVAFSLRVGLSEGAAILVIFLSMLWELVFTLVGGLKTIPNDIKWASEVFHVRGFAFLRKILIPAVVPYLITGSLLAWAEGWNIIIVVEVLHTYIPGGTTTQDLFGIGSILVQAVSTGANATFIAAALMLVGAIAGLNFFVWQKLLRYAERFKFE